MPEIDIDGARVEVRDARLAELYEDQLREAKRALDAYWGPSTDEWRQRFKQALARPQLLAKLADLLDGLVVPAVQDEILHVRVATRETDIDKHIDAAVLARYTYAPFKIEQRFEWYFVRFCLDFLDRNPRIAAALTRTRQRFVANVLLACDRVWADHEELGRTFFPGRRWSCLDRIIATGSDLHKGGQQVLILECSTAPLRDEVALARGPAPQQLERGSKLTRVVYKPTDIELDYWLVGNTLRVQPSGAGATLYQPNPKAPVPSIEDKLDRTPDQSPAYEVPDEPRSLTEIVNALFKDDASSLPTYRILPRNPGSQLADDGLRNAYGYLQYLTHEPELDEVSTSPSEASIVEALHARLGEVEHPDWHTTSETIEQRFFAQCGRLMGLVLLASINDLHVENCIVHRCMPHLIDLESSFIGPLAEIGLSSFPSACSKLSAPHDYFTVAANGYGHVPRHEIAKNRLVKGDGLAAPKDHRGIIFKSFVDTVAVLRSRDARALLEPWLKRVSHCVARCVPLPTTEFQVLFRAYYGELSEYDSREKWLAEQRKELIGKWLSTFERLHGQPQELWIKPNFAIAESILDGLAEGDIPSFYHRLDSTDLLDSHGRVVAVDYGTVRDGLAAHKKAALAGAVAAHAEAHTAHYFPAKTIDVVTSQLLSPDMDDEIAARVTASKATIARM